MGSAPLPSFPPPMSFLGTQLDPHLGCASREPPLRTVADQIWGLRGGETSSPGYEGGRPETGHTGLEAGQGCRFPCGQVAVLVTLPEVHWAVHHPEKRCPNPERLPSQRRADEPFPGLDGCAQMSPGHLHRAEGAKGSLPGKCLPGDRAGPRKRES